MAATSIFLVSFRLSLNSLMAFGKCLFVIRLKDSVAQAESIKAKLLYFRYAKPRDPLHRYVLSLLVNKMRRGTFVPLIFFRG